LSGYDGLRWVADHFIKAKFASSFSEEDPARVPLPRPKICAQVVGGGQEQPKNVACTKQKQLPMPVKSCPLAL